MRWLFYLHLHTTNLILHPKLKKHFPAARQKDNRQEYHESHKRFGFVGFRKDKLLGLFDIQGKDFPTIPKAALGIDSSSTCLVVEALKQ